MCARVRGQQARETLRQTFRHRGTGRATRQLCLRHEGLPRPAVGGARPRRGGLLRATTHHRRAVTPPAPRSRSAAATRCSGATASTEWCWPTCRLRRRQLGGSGHSNRRPGCHCRRRRGHRAGVDRGRRREAPGRRARRRRAGGRKCGRRCDPATCLHSPTSLISWCCSPPTGLSTASAGSPSCSSPARTSPSPTCRSSSPTAHQASTTR